MDVLGYVRTLAWGPRDRTEPEPQEEAIRLRAALGGHRVVAILHDELVPGCEGLERRLALAKTLDMLRDGSAKAVVVARLDRLADDLVLQERILADVRGCGGSVFSAETDEEDELEEEPANPYRAVVRRVLATSGGYEREKRELHIRYGVTRTRVARDRQNSAVALIETLARDGATVEEITARLHAEGFRPGAGYLFGRVRLRRVLAGHRLGPAPCTGTR